MLISEVLPKERLKASVMNKNNALLQIVNLGKDLNFQQENIWIIVDRMEK